MDQLVETVKNTVRWYAAGAANARTFFSIDEEHQTYVVTIVSNKQIFRPALVVMARVENDKVVIEEDLTDKPLVDALIQAGIPREHIVLAYAGEKLEEPQTPVT